MLFVIVLFCSLNIKFKWNIISCGNLFINNRGLFNLQHNIILVSVQCCPGLSDGGSTAYKMAINNNSCMD